MNTEPVLWSLLPALAVAVGTAIQLILDDHTAAGIAAAVAGLLIAVGGAFARARVSPVAKIEAQSTAPPPQMPAR